MHARLPPTTAPATKRALLAIALLFAIGCGKERAAGGDPLPSPVVPAAAATPLATAPPEAISRPTPGRPAVVVFLGDSLTAGLGLSAEEAFPHLLQERLAQDGVSIQAVNAGVSGDTSAGGLRRVSWLLRQHPDLLVVELGANDALRGQPIDGIESNLREVIRRGRAAGARVLLLGLQVPPNLGHDYAAQFAAIYPRVARDLGVPLVPFMLEGVAGKPELNLPDGLHPNEEGHRIVAEVVRPYLEKTLTQRQATAASR